MNAPLLPSALVDAMGPLVSRCFSGALNIGVVRVNCLLCLTQL